MTRKLKIGEARTHVSGLLEKVEAGEDSVICRGPTPTACVAACVNAREHAALCATLRREREKRGAVTTSELLAWRHEGHVR